MHFTRTPIVDQREATRPEVPLASLLSYPCDATTKLRPNTKHEIEDKLVRMFKRIDRARFSIEGYIRRSFSNY